MFYRCANDVCFGYCKGEPDWDVKPSDKTGDLLGGHCRLNPETCGKYQTLTEQVKARKEEIAAARSKGDGGLL